MQPAYHDCSTGNQYLKVPELDGYSPPLWTIYVALIWYRPEAMPTPTALGLRHPSALCFHWRSGSAPHLPAAWDLVTPGWAANNFEGRNTNSNGSRLAVMVDPVLHQPLLPATYSWWFSINGGHQYGSPMIHGEVEMKDRQFQNLKKRCCGTYPSTPKNIRDHMTTCCKSTALLITMLFECN